MQGDEALKRFSMYARSDIGKKLPPNDCSRSSLTRYGDGLTRGEPPHASSDAKGAVRFTALVPSVMLHFRTPPPQRLADADVRLQPSKIAEITPGLSSAPHRAPHSGRERRRIVDPDPCSPRRFPPS